MSTIDPNEKDNNAGLLTGVFVFIYIICIVFSIVGIRNGGGTAPKIFLGIGIAGIIFFIIGGVIYRRKPKETIKEKNEAKNTMFTLTYIPLVIALVCLVIYMFSQGGFSGLMFF